MPLIKGKGADFGPAVLMMVALLAVTTALALAAPETHAQRQQVTGK
jgi:hypothetical protein